MRESSHSFPSTNRACITLSSSLYDRRAIDSPLPTLPLLTSLQHLAYLTSTSPRIREILTQDGGLERLISIVGGCLDLAFPETAAPAVQRLEASTSKLPAATATHGRKRRAVPFKPFSAYADGSDGQDYKNLPAILHTYGFALQCLVNIGVRGSEAIRTRVVEAGILKVVFRILNSFLVNRSKKREELLKIERDQQQLDSVRQQTLNAMQTLITADQFSAGVDDSSRSITLWRDNTGHFPTVPVNGTTNPEEEYLLRSTQHHLPSPQQPSQRLPQPPILTSRSYNGHTELSSFTSAAAAATVYDPSATVNTTITLDALNLPLPTVSRLSSAASLTMFSGINRTSTPDTILSIDEANSDMNDGNDDTESSSQENEQDGDQMDIEDDGRRHLRSRRANRTRLEVGEAASRSASRTRRAMVPKSAPRIPSDDESERASTERDQDGDVNMDDSVDASADMAVEATPVSSVRPSLHQDDHRNPVEQTPLANPQHPLHDLYTQQRQHQQVQQQQQQQNQSHSEPMASSPTFVNNPNQQNATTADLSQPQPTATAPSGPTTVILDHHFKEDDVLHCLHLLAYLSKYPHVRAVFHDPENESCTPIPPTPSPTAVPGASCDANATGSRKKQRCDDNNGEACTTTCCASGVETAESSAANSQDESTADSSVGRSTASASQAMQIHHECPATSSTSHRHRSRRASRDGNGNEDEEEIDEEAEDLARAKALAALPPKERKPALEPTRPPRSTANNVFSLVEQFTFRPSSPSSSSSSSSPSSSNIEKTLRLRSDIQYWAGVIMRNACRKDEVKGGIRQCANMGCGVWERFPREFAKCRRCRKAKYCSKGCQRRAWQAGHRYWCSARQDNPPPQPTSAAAAAGSGTGSPDPAGTPGGPINAAADNMAVTVQIETNNQAPGVEAVDTGDVRDMTEL